jgi:hypothetical protein
MYRVQYDKRCSESCGLIYKALLDVLLTSNPTKNINSITVTELAKRASVSRGTFYRHFDSVIDVLIWKSDSKMGESCKTNLLMHNNYMFVKTFFDYWITQHVFLDSLVCIGRLDLLLCSLEKHIASWSHILFNDVHLNHAKEYYLIRIWSVIIWSVLCTWMHRKRQESSRELTEIAIHNLPDLHGKTVNTILKVEPSVTIHSLEGECSIAYANS